MTGWVSLKKAAFESTNRYLPATFGPKGIRCNLVAAGPIRTTAAKSIPDSSASRQIWDERAPLGWNASTTRYRPPRPALRSLSDWFPATTGEIVHVDGGARHGPVTPR